MDRWTSNEIIRSGDRKEKVGRKDTVGVMDTFRFSEPLWFVAIVPVLVLFWGQQWRWNRRAAVRYSSLDLFEDVPKTWTQRIHAVLPWFRCFGWIAIVIALARPQQGLQEYRVDTEGIAIVMCLDRSGSMLAMDFQLDGQRVNRLEVVKQVFRNFVAGDRLLTGRPNDLIGLVVFGGFAESLAPLTLDHDALIDVLETVEIAEPIRDARGAIVNQAFLAEEQSTAIGDAVTLAVDRLQDAPARSKVIILLSDGENTAGVVEPLQAAEAARQFGIKVYTIGVGTTGYAPFPAETLFGQSILVDRLVKLDEETLKMLAERTGGQYFAAQDADTLTRVYQAIDALEKSVSNGLLYTEYRELYRWWLIPAILLLVTEIVLTRTRFLTWP